MSEDVHAPYVAELFGAGDWAGLLRYALAQGLHGPALQAALRVLEGSYFGSEHAQLRDWLVEFVQNPLEPRESPDLDAFNLDEEERLTLELMRTFPIVALCEMGGQFPVAQQTEVYSLGVQMTEQWHMVAVALQDQALQAFTWGLAARANRELHHLEVAHDSYQEALTIYRPLAASRPDVYLPYVATTLNNLGTVQSDLHEFEAARDSYQEALAIRRELAESRPDVYLPDVAMTLNNLGNVQQNLHAFEAARDSYQEALTIYRQLAESRPDVYLPDVAMTLNNLGNVQSDLHEFEAARDCYQEALTIYRRLASSRPDVYLPDVAMTLNNLGAVQRDLHAFEAARDSYQEARDFYEAYEARLGTSHLMDRILLYGNYARLVLREEDALSWPDHSLARELLRNGCQLVEQFRGLFGDPKERIRVQEEQRSLYRLRIDVCVRCGELFSDPNAYDEALEAAEASGSRSLLDALAQRILPEQAPLELKEQFQQLQRNLRRAQRRLQQELEVLQTLIDASQEDASPPATPADVSEQEDGEGKPRLLLNQPRYTRCATQLTGDLASERDQVQRVQKVEQYIQDRAPEYLRLVDQLRVHDPSFNPDLTVSSFRLDERAAVFPADKNTRYVHMMQVSETCLALILSPDGLLPVPLTELNKADSDDLARLLLAPQLSGGITSKQMQTLLESSLPEVLEQLRPVVQQNLLPALEQSGLELGDRLVLVPDNILSFLPWHAVAVDEQRTTLGDRYEVCYTRSLSVLQQCLRRERPEPQYVFGMVDPTHTLAGPALEAEFARQHFETLELPETINHQSLLEGAAEADVFYWMGHSQFRLDIPYWSGLLLNESGEHMDEKGEVQSRYPLAPTDLATYIDIDCGLTLNKCSLAIISGCQSGLAFAGKGNEPVSLISAFLNAGAKCVLASLWPVDDGACLLTTWRFMKAWREEGQHLAAALKTAQTWLRDLTANELLKWCEDREELQRKEFRELKQDLQRRARMTKDFQQTHPYRNPYYWAPFITVGQSWNE